MGLTKAQKLSQPQRLEKVLALLDKGMTRRDIATQLGMSRSAVSNLARTERPDYKKLLEALLFADFENGITKGTELSEKYGISTPLVSYYKNKYKDSGGHLPESKNIGFNVSSAKTLINNDIVKGERDTDVLAKKYSITPDQVRRYKEQYLDDRDLPDKYAMSTKEIAIHLNLSEKTVSNLLHSAKVKMRLYCEEKDMKEDLLEYLDEDKGRNYG